MKGEGEGIRQDGRPLKQGAKAEKEEKKKVRSLEHPEAQPCRSRNACTRHAQLGAGAGTWCIFSDFLGELGELQASPSSC